MEQLKNNLPIISLGLLILGTVNLMLYYNHFNVDILSYLDFTEILQIQFRLFATAAALIVFLILYITISQKVSDFVDNGKKENPDGSPTEEELERRKKSAKRSRIGFVLFMVLIFILNIVSTTYATADDSNVGISFLWLFSVLLVAVAVIYTYFQLKKVAEAETTDEVKRKQGLTTLKYVGIFIILTYVSGVFARLSAEDVLSHTSSYEATVVMEKKTFITNKNYRYLGRTKNFTFFYDMVKKQAEVYPNGDIKNMFIREGIDYRTPDKKQGFTITFSFTSIVNWFKGLFT